MSQTVAERLTQRARLAPRPEAAAWQAPDARRRLQLALAGLWLLDAVLQYQSFMFSRAFGRMLSQSAAGNPAWIAGPIRWNAALTEHHSVLLNAIFATIQLAIALGIAARPTVRIALAASVAWSLTVWWLGEGLGGILSGSASPLGGAPGPVLLYALIAVLAWPADRDPAAPFVAGRAVGTQAAKVIWLAFWAAMTWFAVQPSNLTATGPHDVVGELASGEPHWLASIVAGAAALLAGRGVTVLVVLAVVFAVIAVSVFLPPALARVVLAGTIVLAAALFVAGQALGGMLTGMGTDPGSGPLLALLALLYWPGRERAAGPERERGPGLASRAAGAEEAGT
jgi:hypothetical protein